MSAPEVETRVAQVGQDQAGLRFDQCAAALWEDLSRSQAKKLIQQGLLLLNGQPARCAQKVKAGDELELNLPLVPEFSLVPQPIPLEILYEDEALLVVNKPTGLVVHPAPGHPDGTLVNALLWHSERLAESAEPFRPGLVHRLDKDTSGLLVVAKREDVQADLQRQIQARSAQRTYLALVWGRPKFEELRHEAPIARHPVHRKQFTVRPTGRPAVTLFKVRERFSTITLLEAVLQTGRTHQIRVHCTHLGHPVVGDPVYGASSPNRANLGKHQSRFNALFAALPGQALHAWRLAFDHPLSHKRLEFEAPLPEPFANLVDFLQNLGREV